MPRLRALIAVLIALLLAIVPASASAVATSLALASTSTDSGCGTPCPMAVESGDMAGMPMTGDCGGMADKGAPGTQSTCAALCGGFVTLPTSCAVMIEKMPGKLLSPDALAALDGRIDPPELRPPKIN
jgi:hypothetical protein